MLILKRKTSALLCLEEEEIETDLLLQNHVRGSTIDFQYAHSLGLISAPPAVFYYTDNTKEVKEYVNATIKVKGNDDKERAFNINLALTKHYNREKSTIKIGRAILNKLQIYLDFNE